jgi:general stress protein 26
MAGKQAKVLSDTDVLEDRSKINEL